MCFHQRLALLPTTTDLSHKTRALVLLTYCLSLHPQSQRPGAATSLLPLLPVVIIITPCFAGRVQKVLILLLHRARTPTHRQYKYA